MKIFSFKILLVFISIFASCNGQVIASKDKANNKDTASTAQTPMLMKFPGANEYDAVNHSIMDKAGNLWFSTTGGGVYRYDGKLFTQFTQKDGLSNDFVWDLYEDTSGEIWIGTADGVSRWNGKQFINIPITVITNNSKPYSPTTVDSYGMPSSQNSIWKIMEDSKGNFWFGASDGLYKFDGKSYSHFTHNDGVSNNTGIKIQWIEGIAEDKAGKIWFGGRGTEGLFCYDGKELSNYTPTGIKWLKPKFIDKKGNIWFGNWSSFFKYDGNSFEPFTLKDGNCLRNTTSIYEDSKGNLWFTSDDKEGGICRFDGKTSVHLTTKNGLIHNSVWSIVEDRTGNLWIGTRNTGLCRYDGSYFTFFSK